MPYDRSRAVGNHTAGGGWEAVGYCRKPSSQDSTIFGVEGLAFFCIMAVVIPVREVVSVWKTPRIWGNSRIYLVRAHTLEQKSILTEVKCYGENR